MKTYTTESLGCGPGTGRIAEGRVTEVLGEHIEFRAGEKRARLAVTYEFFVGDDGPYTGESFWTPILCSIQRVAQARKKVHARQRVRVRVRYRRDDPSINTLDGGVARLLNNREDKMK